MADVLTYVLSGVGAATGVVGAVTGIIALIRSGRFKTLDLRLELRKGENDLRAVIDELPGQMKRATWSRQNIHAMRGLGGSGVAVAWQLAMDADTKTYQEIAKARPPEEQDHRGLSAADLESRIIELDAVLSKAKGLRDKYVAALATDDQDRGQRQQTYEAAAIARMRGPAS